MTEHNPFATRTSSYLLRVPTDTPHQTLNEMLAENKQRIPVEQTAVDSLFAGLRFRCPSNDILAMDLARQIANGREFVLSTGYGAHSRHVGASE